MGKLYLYLYGVELYAWVMIETAVSGLLQCRPAGWVASQRQAAAAAVRCLRGRFAAAADADDESNYERN